MGSLPRTFAIAFQGTVLVDMRLFLLANKELWERPVILKMDMGNTHWFNILIKLQRAAFETIPSPQDHSWDNPTIIPKRPPHVFRGEPVANGPITSSLYREFKDYVDNKDPANREEFLDSLQLCLLEKVAAVLPDVDENHIQSLRDQKDLLRSPKARRLLYRLRHRGFPTNIVDFTGNLTVAVYFACQEGFDRKDGRILFFASSLDQLLQPDVSDDLRMMVQNSRFYWLTQGTFSVEKKEWVRKFSIPKEHKSKLRHYLRCAHNMTHATLFPDLEGVMEEMQRLRGQTGHDRKTDAGWRKTIVEQAEERPTLYPLADAEPDRTAESAGK